LQGHTKNGGIVETNCIYTKSSIHLTPKSKTIHNYMEKSLGAQDEEASRGPKMGDNTSYEKVN
jgi:hypothetical protein